jgi:hypothetical protein
MNFFKISFRSSDRPLKSEILTFCGILKLSAGQFVKVLTFGGLSCGKAYLFSKSYCGKACLSAC